MHKPNLSNMFRSIRLVVSKHSPEILTGVGIAGMITTTVLAVKATPKALKLIEEKKKADRVDELTPLDTVKTCWKPYASAAVTGTFSIACLIGANSVNARRNAALATAYKISETALTEYREKVVETFGEKKEQQVRDNVDQARLEKNPVTTSEVIITEKGNTLCYDSISGRYFKSDIESIKRAQNELNRRIITDMYVSLNELYDELDLDHTKVGDDLGWHVNKGLIDIRFGTQIADDGTPCIVVDYQVAPYYDFYKFG